MSTDTDQQEMHALALSTAERIEAQAKAIEFLQSFDGDYQAVGAADSVIKARSVLDLDPLKVDEDADDGLEEACERLRYEGPLSVRKRGYNDGSGWHTDEVEIVLGTGGPHVQIEYQGDSATVTALGWFGAGKTSLPVDPAAVELLYGVDYLYNDEDQ